MTESAATPNGDNGQRELTLEGCTARSDADGVGGHCHRPRSLRQADTLTPDGRRKVCHRPAGWGTQHVGVGGCKLHMGNVTSSVISAERATAKQMVKTYGLNVKIDPVEAMLEEVERTVGAVRWLQGIIGELPQGEVVYGLSEESIEPDVRDDDGRVLVANVSGKMKAAPSIWVDLYQKERRHLREVCRDAIAAGVSMRMITMYEQSADTYVSMFERAINQLGLTPEQRQQYTIAVMTELRAIAGEVE
jgi:hypothetical protein